MSGYALVDIENVWRLFFDDELIRADNDFFFRLRGPLKLVGSLSDLFLRISPLNGFHHPAHRVQLTEIVERAVFHLQGQALKKVRSTKRINRLHDPRFIANDLLSA